MINPYDEDHIDPFFNNDVIRQLSQSYNLYEIKKKLASHPRSCLWSEVTWWTALHHTDPFIQKLTLYALAQQLGPLSTWYPHCLEYHAHYIDRLNKCIQFVSVDISEELLDQQRTLSMTSSEKMNESLAQSHFETLYIFAQAKLYELNKLQHHYETVVSLSSVIDKIRAKLAQQYDQHSKRWSQDELSFQTELQQLIKEETHAYLIDTYLLEDDLESIRSDEDTFGNLEGKAIYVEPDDELFTTREGGLSSQKPSHPITITPSPVLAPPAPTRAAAPSSVLPELGAPRPKKSTAVPKFDTFDQEDMSVFPLEELPIPAAQEFPERMSYPSAEPPEIEAVGDSFQEEIMQKASAQEMSSVLQESMQKESTRDRKVADDGVPFVIKVSPYIASRSSEEAEDLLSEDCGHPGPLEYATHKSNVLIRCWHATLGLYSLYIIHFIDTLWELISGYVKNIFKVFMVIRSMYRVRRQMQKGQLATHVKTDTLACLQAFEQLLYFPQYLQTVTTYKQENEPAHQSSLALAIYARTTLDTLQRDLTFVHRQSVKESVFKALKNWILDLIPKPWNLLQPFLDLYRLLFKVKFSRKDTILIYHDLQFSFANLHKALQRRENAEYSSQSTFSEDDDKLLIALIQQCKKVSDQMLKLSLQSYYLATPHRWSTFDLFSDWVLQDKRHQWFNTNTLLTNDEEEQKLWHHIQPILHPKIQSQISQYLFREIKDTLAHTKIAADSFEKLNRQLELYQKELIL